MKILTIAIGLVISVTAQAHSNIEMLLSQNKTNTFNFQVNYPNGPIEVIRSGRLTSEQGPADCLALIYGEQEEEISGYNLREIANSIIVESDYEKQIHTLSLNGTIIFKTRIPFQLYADFYTIKTKSGESFLELKNRILGENKAMSLKLAYIRNCAGVK